jgi:hypothetical protein
MNASPAPQGRQPVPAVAELVALATATRPDWHPADVREALAAADVAGMTWPRALTDVARLLADPHATPRDLVPAPWDPTLRRPPLDPDRTHRLAAAARAGITRLTRHTPEGGEKR